MINLQILRIYLKIRLYNCAFSKNISIMTLIMSNPIIRQLKKLNCNKNFNHYMTLQYMITNTNQLNFSDKTFDNFEKLFTEIKELI